MALQDLKKQSDETLMALLIRGEIQVFDELYTRYSNRLLFYFFRMLGNNEELAQDFLQNLFLKIIENPGLYHKNRKFSSWIFTIAYNMCKNEYRNTATRKKLIDEVQYTYENSGSVDTEQNLNHEEFKNALYNELDQFDESQKSVFLLRFREQLSIKEISDILGCSEGTVKSRLFYTTKKLAKTLKHYHPNHSEV